jgi:mRNA interferase RelE/StbE
MTIRISKAARKQLSKLDEQTRNRILSALYKLRDRPDLVDSKKLKTKTDRMRIRVGDYRAVVSVDQENKVYRVIEVGHRRDIYRD